MSSIREEYKQAYRAVRKFWKLVDRQDCSATSFWKSMAQSHSFDSMTAASDSCRMLRNHQHNQENPLWCGKWTFPIEVAKQI